MKKPAPGNQERARRYFTTVTSHHNHGVPSFRDYFPLAFPATGMVMSKTFSPFCTVVFNGVVSGS